MTNDNNNSTTTIPPPQVRHAGRARIRGKIRRVWRSRYLELLDQGIVQYYEFPEETTTSSPKNHYSPTPSNHHHDDAGYGCNTLLDSWHGAGTGDAVLLTARTTTTTTTTASNNNNNNNTTEPPSNNNDDDNLLIPKYTLQISHARILDPTTLRDMHVGLPRGTYGFTFRGQRLVPASSSAAAQQQAMPGGSTTTTMLQSPSSVVGSCAAEMEQQQQQPPLTNNRSTIDIIALEPRDFLCAVPTLEEAQMWVVALQWAASERVVVESISELKQQEQQQQESLLLLQQQQQQTTHDDFVNVSVPPEGEGEGEGADESLQSHSDNHDENINTTTRTATVPDQPTTTTRTTTTAPSGGGRAVVTKVTTLRLVRTATWNWEWAYEIHGMFLWNQNNKSSNHQKSSSPSSVELWTVLRTAHDFGTLVQELQRELCGGKNNEASLSRLDMLVQPLQELPRIRKTTSKATQSNTNSTTTEKLQNSITTVDGILRSLVTDASLLRTNAMKSFLGLTASSTTTTAKTRTATTKKTSETLTSWWHRMSELHNSQAIQERRVEQLDDPAVKDAYVKQWLAKHQHQSSSSRRRRPPASSSSTISLLDSCAAQVLQRPLLILGGLGASSVVVLLPLAKWAWSLCDKSLPTITLRADHLVCTWIGAAYLGYQYNNNSSSAHSNQQSTRLRKQQQRQQESTSVQSKSSQKDQTTGEETPVDERDVDDDSSSEGEAPAANAADLSIASSDPLLADSANAGLLSSPLPKYPENDGTSCWSQPPHNIFHVRSVTYLQDRVKEPSGPPPLTCRGVDVWINDNPERHIARHPAVLGGKLGEKDTFLVNFLLPFGNFVAYFDIPPLSQFPTKLRNVWTKFLKGDQQYRDARLKLLPVVAEGPWIVKAAVGPGKSPALLGKVIPLQYFFRDPDDKRAGVYEVDVIITASSIAKGILSVVKGNTKTVSIAFAFIIEAAEQEELPETVLCSCQVHFLDLEQCPLLPPCDLDDVEQQQQQQQQE